MRKLKSAQRDDEKAKKQRDLMKSAGAQIFRRATAESGRIDGWENALTGLGQLARDKRMSADFIANRVIDIVAEEVWRGDAIFAAIVESPVDEAIDAGWELVIQPPPEKKKVDSPADVFPDTAAIDDGKQIAEEVMAYEKRLLVPERFSMAFKQERAKGGAAIFVRVDDGIEDLRIPLEPRRVKAVTDLIVLEPMECIPYQWYLDELSSKFGKPELYYMQRLTSGIASMRRTPIHESRLILFPGTVVSQRQTREHWGWGDSMLVRVGDDLRDFHQAHGSSAALVMDFSQAIFGIEGLADILRTGQEELLVRRARFMDKARSILRAMIIDKNETFERKTTSVAGLSDLLADADRKLASSARMPLTRLMGQAAAGLNATGIGDERIWLKGISAWRTKAVLPRLEQLTKLIFAASDGPTGGREPEQWTYKFGDLWQPTEGEVAQTRKTVAETDAIYVNTGVLVAEEVTKSRFGGAKYSAETTLDHELREAFEAEEDDDAETEAAALRAEVEAKKNAPVLQQ